MIYTTNTIRAVTNRNQATAPTQKEINIVESELKLFNVYPSAIFDAIAKYVATVRTNPDNVAIRGLMFCGPCGIGKTYAARVLSAMTGAAIYSEREIGQIFSDGGERAIRDWLTQLQYVDLIIDDLGAGKNYRHYNDALDVGGIIEIRYDSWIRQGRRLHLSTNATEAERKIEYGERVVDRLNEMCEKIVVTGASRRRNASADRQEKKP